MSVLRRYRCDPRTSRPGVHGNTTGYPADAATMLQRHARHMILEARLSARMLKDEPPLLSTQALILELNQHAVVPVIHR